MAKQHIHFLFVCCRYSLWQILEQNFLQAPYRQFRRVGTVLDRLSACGFVDGWIRYMTSGVGWIRQCRRVNTIIGSAVGWVRYMAMQSGGYGTWQCSRVGTVHGSAVGWVRYMAVQSGGYGTWQYSRVGTVHDSTVGWVRYTEHDSECDYKLEASQRDDFSMSWWLDHILEIFWFN